MVTLAAEAEMHGFYHNARVAIPLIHLLIEMGHQQLPIPIKIDISIATGFVNSNIQLKRSKAWDIKLHWLRDNHNKQFFMFSGREVKTMMPITSQNIILLFIIDNNEKKLYKILSKSFKRIYILYIVIGQVTGLRGCVNPTHISI